ncbi:MAG: molecular chaperone DnaJ [Planctomycetaceae bacterium]|nr:MAG: molecular chaperone DnaJ [Planctomycetaceae bacterium]
MSQLEHIGSPEQQELARKKAILAALEAKLAEQELRLATLRGKQHAFEAKYMTAVGCRYAELDRIEAQIAAIEARRRPHDQRVAEESRTASARAEESARAAREAGTTEPNKFVPTEDLKTIYRQAAKSLHPDLCSDPAEHKRRQVAMAEVNQAYEAGDAVRIRQILNEWQARPEAVAGQSVAEQLVRIIRQIAQVKDRIQVIRNEIEMIKASDLFGLRKSVRDAARNGRDLLKEMAATVDEQIRLARQRLSEISQGVHL